MIVTNNLTVTGTISNIPLYTNTLSSQSLSNIAIQGGVHVDGDVNTTGLLKEGNTIFLTYRLVSDTAFGAQNNLVANSNFELDLTASDMTSSSNIQLSIPTSAVFNRETGVFTAPSSGFYSCSMQGAFSNDMSAFNPLNGVYYNILNHSHSNARIAASIGPANIAHTSHMVFLLAGDTLRPTFYSTDANATLIANGESFIKFTLIAPIQPQHSNYYRT